MTTPTDEHGPTLVLGTSNGTGMGHLTRQVAVATALRPAVEPVVFSMSAAVPAIASYGLRAEYCPSRERGWMPAKLWQRYAQDRLLALLSETNARVFAFDGVMPYPGILLARRATPDVAYVWFRRGMWRPRANSHALRAAGFFDLIIEPGDLAASTDSGLTARRTDALRVPPISLVEHESQLPRRQAAVELGLDPNRPTALVSLGSHGDATDPAATAVAALLESPDLQIAVTQSHIAHNAFRSAETDRIIELRNVYPLARYLRAFDLAVSAAGYNAFHELIFAGIPTLLVPSPRGTDDQNTRAAWAGRQGVAIVADADDIRAVTEQTFRLTEPSRREDLAAACNALPRPTGSAAAAKHLNELACSFGGHRSTGAERIDTAGLHARALVQRAIGTRGVSIARELLGRPTIPGPTSRLPVMLGEPPDPATATARRLLMTENLDDLSTDVIVEHMLPASSPDYWRTRRSIASKYYDVRP